MKRLIFFLAFSTLLSIGKIQAYGGGVTVVVVHDKVGATCSLSIPDYYVNKEGCLIAPLVVKIANNKTTIVTESKDLNIHLPSGLSGVYVLNISIEDYRYTTKLNL